MFPFTSCICVVLLPRCAMLRNNKPLSYFCRHVMFCEKKYIVLCALFTSNKTLVLSLEKRWQICYFVNKEGVWQCGCGFVVVLFRHFFKQWRQLCHIRQMREKMQKRGMKKTRQKRKIWAKRQHELPRSRLHLANTYHVLQTPSKPPLSQMLLKIHL